MAFNCLSIVSSYDNNIAIHRNDDISVPPPAFKVKTFRPNFEVRQGPIFTISSSLNEYFFYSVFEKELVLIGSHWKSADLWSRYAMIRQTTPHDKTTEGWRIPLESLQLLPQLAAVRN